ncbi:MAG TPA: hypothetical protein VNQ76_02765, partial [Planctomicrobium sp.]|nr:hypothetical protein [Planctomicrobium sp.]
MEEEQLLVLGQQACLLFPASWVSGGERLQPVLSEKNQSLVPVKELQEKFFHSMRRVLLHPPQATKGTTPVEQIAMIGDVIGHVPDRVPQSISLQPVFLPMLELFPQTLFQSGQQRRTKRDLVP